MTEPKFKVGDSVRIDYSHEIIRYAVVVGIPSIYRGAMSLFDIRKLTNLGSSAKLGSNTFNKKWF